MKITFPTTQLQAVLNKAVKGAGNNKLIPMTSLIAIEASGDVAKFTTTDATNYLMMTASISDLEFQSDSDFYVAVQVDLLAKLVSKMTSDRTTLEVTDSGLNIIGNGRYQIELDVDDDGNPIRLPNPIDKFEKGESIGAVQSSVIANSISSLKSALLDKEDYPWYECYYINNEFILATDTYTVASYKRGFLDKPFLVSSEMMDLIGLLLGDISVYSNNNALLFESDNGVVYGKVTDGIDRYSVDELNAFVEQDFEFSCKVAKPTMLNLLDRISLFVSPYDNGEITLTFKADGLEVSSDSANELITYAEPSEKSGDFICKTDITTLISQFKSQLSDVIEIQYGEDNAIKLVDGELTSVVALIEE